MNFRILSLIPIFMLILLMLQAPTVANSIQVGGTLTIAMTAEPSQITASSA
ncbi:MAG: hypothetical protein ACP5GN_04700 [Fervidicoccaceae archaeon]